MPGAASDEMQDIFMGVYRNLPGYRGDGAFPAWLDVATQLGISPNTAKTRLYAALRKLRDHEELRDAL